jgi:hypothetical protein
MSIAAEYLEFIHKPLPLFSEIIIAPNALLCTKIWLENGRYGPLGLHTTPIQDESLIRISKLQTNSKQ